MPEIEIRSDADLTKLKGWTVVQVIRLTHEHPNGPSFTVELSHPFAEHNILITFRPGSSGILNGAFGTITIQPIIAMFTSDVVPEVKG